MAYLNPLHPPLPLSHRSSYTTLSPHATQPTHPPLQTAPALPPALRRLPQALPIPHTRPHAPPVTFDLLGAPARGLGLPMRELLARSGSAIAKILVDAGEAVPADSRKFTLHIMWPGYEHLQWSLPLNVLGVTRGSLAVQIARAFSVFCEHAQKSLSLPPAPHAAPLPAVSFQRLILVAAWNLRDDVWMAE
ncbi:hypothetical protein BJ138DRAFT_1230430, partial [Hygrophoropsis aurantiaca]